MPSGVPSRPKSPTVSSRLFESTAASRSRLAALNKGTNDAQSPEDSSQAAISTKSAMPLSLAPKRIVTSGSTNQRPLSPGPSQRLQQPIPKKDVVKPSPEGNTRLVSNDPLVTAEGGARRTPLRARKTDAPSVVSHNSRATGEAPPTGARYRTPTRTTTQKAVPASGGLSPSSPRTVPSAPSPARFASPGGKRSSPSRRSETPKRSASPSLPSSVKQTSQTSARLPSPSMTTESKKVKRLTAKPRESPIVAEITLSSVGSSPPPSSDSLQQSPKLSLMTLDELIYTEDITRVELLAMEEADRCREYEVFLTSHDEYLSLQISRVNRLLVCKEKMKLHDELKGSISNAKVEIARMRKAVTDFNVKEKENEALKAQVAALKNYGKLRSAKIRQKQATMEFLQKTTTELATSGDVLIANLFVEIETLSGIAEMCARRHEFSDSKNSLPLECMAVLSEIDFMRELHFERLVGEVDQYKAEGLAINDDMRSVRQQGQESLLATEDQYVGERATLLKAWETEKKKLEKDSKALKKEITDLNFQIRRGSNIKSLSQLPISNNQIERNRVRALYLDTESQKQELDSLRAAEANLRQELLTMRTYHSNKEEDMTAVIQRSVKERTRLEALKDSYREEIVRLQRGALTFTPPQESPAPELEGRNMAQLEWSAKDARKNNTLDDIDDDESGPPTVADGTIQAPPIQTFRSSNHAYHADPESGKRILSADEALRILAEIEAADESRRSKVHNDNSVYSHADSELTTSQLTPIRGRSRTPTGNRRQGGPSLLDRLCKPTKQFSSYIDARVQEDATRKQISIQLNDGRPDARR